ncbi:permease [Corynebacterium sp. 13CS0277]|nr:permease [Corynebacterium sp. 13CS0277]
MWLVPIVFIVVAVGAGLQRVAGMGLGLIAATILSVVIGPVDGVLIVNVLAVFTAVSTTWAARRDVDWGKFALIAPVMVLGSLPAALLITRIDKSGLQVLVGLTLLIALSVTTFGQRWVPRVTSNAWAMLAGVVGGFTNTLAAIAGPVITVYAQASRWEHHRFAATLQPLFIVTGFLSVAMKTLVGAGHVTDTPWPVWAAGVAGLTLGVFAGGRLARRVPRDKARVLALTVAIAGAISALLHGLIGILG